MSSAVPAVLVAEASEASVVAALCLMAVVFAGAAACPAAVFGAAAGIPAAVAASTGAAVALAAMAVAAAVAGDAKPDVRSGWKEFDRRGNLTYRSVGRGKSL